MADEPTLFDTPDEAASTGIERTLIKTRRRAPKESAPMLLGSVNDDVKTEGIKYAGSKLKILPQLLSLVRDLPVTTVLDGFSGSTRVSQALAKNNYSVISNDRAEWSECFATAYLLNSKPASAYQALIDHLNNLKPTAGWFTENYGGVDDLGSAIQPDGSKRLWQIHNTMMLDAIRTEIDALSLDTIEKSIALSALILALDRVDSTMGHFVAYLKEWSPRSYLQMELEVPLLFQSSGDHTVQRKDIFDCISDSEEVDLAYFDPPYGSNNEKMPPSRVRYQSYYHIWKTVVLNDQPDLFGAANRRADSSDKVAGSVFEEFRRSDSGRFIAMESIEKLIQQTQARFIALSYSNGGRATAAELDAVLREHGKILKVAEVDYKKNVMAGMRWTNEWLKDNDEQKNIEFIFLLEKG